MNGITILLIAIAFGAGTLLGIQLEMEYVEYLERKKQARFNRMFPTIEESMRADGWTL